MPCLVAEEAIQARELAGPFIDIGVPEDYRKFDINFHDYVSQG